MSQTDLQPNPENPPGSVSFETTKQGVNDTEFLLFQNVLHAIGVLRDRERWNYVDAIGEYALVVRLIERRLRDRDGR